MNYLRSLVFVLWLYGSMVVLGIVFLPALLLPRSATVLGIRTWARCARWGVPLLPVHHMQGHALTPRLLACEEQGAAAGDGAKRISGAAVSGSAAGDAGGELAEEWEENDDGQGTKFWYNKKTGQSVWTRPAPLTKPR